MDEKPHLYIIPIAHTYTDTGSFRDKIPFDEQYEASVTRYWVEIFRYLNSLPLYLLRGLHVYQDGLVNVPGGIVDKIVEGAQSANYEILRWLKERGAVIFGTEDPNLLREEHEALEAFLNCPDGEAKTAAGLEYLEKSNWVLGARDKYIAQRIRETLPKGRTGLLFIGAAHDVGSHLGNKIRVSTPERISRALQEVLRDLVGLGKERR